MASIKLKGDTSGELTIQAPSVAGTNTLDLPASSGTLLTTTGNGSQLTGLPNSYAGTKNLIINGNMQIAQRGTSLTGVTSGNNFVADRFMWQVGTAGTWTMTQDTDVPSGQGFANSMKLACTTANASLSAGSYGVFAHRFEGQNLQQLKKGTSNAEKVTVSFWIKSNKTGTYQSNLRDVENTRLIGYEFTINSADTWEKKIITFDGDTSGAIDNDNNLSLQWEIWFVAGSIYSGSGSVPTAWEATDNTDRYANPTINLADSTSNYVNITGVQLEVGTTATDFENLQYGQQLALCQRYYERYTGSFYMPVVAGNAVAASGFRVTKRAAPTVSYTSTGGSVSAVNPTTDAVSFTLYGSTTISINTWTATSEL